MVRKQAGADFPEISPEKKTFIDGDCYRGDFLSSYHPQITLAASNKGQPFVFQQDKATPHGTPENVAWLNRNMKGWMQNWSGKGADLNPLDYCVWNALQEKVWADMCKTQLELKASILKHVLEFPQDCIERAIDAFPRRLQMCLGEEGGYFEHKLGKFSQRGAIITGNPVYRNYS